MSTKNQKLMSEVHAVMRREHYSIHTERFYADWIKQFVRFHGMTSREDLEGGEAKIEAYLTHLAVERNVAPSTQNQAMTPWFFCTKRFLNSLSTAGSMPSAPESGVIRRHHIDPSVINKAIKAAAGRVGIHKRVSSHTFTVSPPTF